MQFVAVIELLLSFFTSSQVPENLTGFMSNVALPIHDEDKVSVLQSRLFKEHNISVVYHSVNLRSDFAVPAHLNELQGEGTLVFFVRLSAQVYLELSDFELLADTVLQLLRDL